MDKREELIQVKCQSIDGDAAAVSVYRIGQDFSLAATIEHDGDYEVVLRKSEIQALVQALTELTSE